MATSAAAGLVGPSVMGATAGIVMGGLDNLMTTNNNNQPPQEIRRASTPGSSTGGGFSSIFNLKSVISAATKSSPGPQQQSLPPVAGPSESNVIESNSQSHTATAPQKSVQGIVISSSNVVVFAGLF